MPLPDIVGRPPERLTLTEQRALAGQWIALERYNPATMPLRVIAAIGPSPGACAAELRRQGREPAGYEFLPVVPPF